MLTAEDWNRLAREVRRRRKELDLSKVKAAALSRSRPVNREGKVGLSDQTWTGIERADRQSRQDNVLADLSWTLGWTDDSARRILEGHAPIERTDVPAHNTAADKSRHLTATDEHVLKALQELCSAIQEMIEERGR